PSTRQTHDERALRISLTFCAGDLQLENFGVVLCPQVLQPTELHRAFELLAQLEVAAAVFEACRRGRILALARTQPPPVLAQLAKVLLDHASCTWRLGRKGFQL